MVLQTTGGRPRTAPHPSLSPSAARPLPPTPPPIRVQSFPGVSASSLQEPGKDGGWRRSEEKVSPEVESDKDMRVTHSLARAKR